MIEIKANMNSSNTIIRQYQIITDQIDICHLICRKNCVQKLPNYNDYFISTPMIELILFCVKCNFSEIYNQLNHFIVYFYLKLSRDSALFYLKITYRFQQMTLNCTNDKNQISLIHSNFHLINPNRTTPSFFCSINPMRFYPYHEEFILECENFSTRADIIIWAITQLG